MDKKKLNYLAGVVSVIVNTLLFVIKYWAGIVSGSVALLADAWHTMSDSLSSIVVIAGVKLSSRKADKEHPFGHGRMENVVSIFVGIMLAIVAYEFIVQSIEKFKNPDSKAIFGTLAIVVTIASILIKEAMAQFSFWIARKTNNTSVKADGWHHRSDAFSSIIVLIGIFFQKYFWWIDAVLGFCVSLILLYAVYKIISESISKLLGEEVPPEIIEDVKKVIVSEYNNDLGAHHFHLHNYGDHKELTFHIKVNGNATVAESHNIATHIEQMLLHSFNLETTIHMEPEDTKG